MKKKVSTIWTEDEMLKLRDLLPNSMVSRVNNPNRCPDPDYRDVWRTLTLGERTFLVVFWGAFHRNNFNNLLALYRGNRARANEVLARLEEHREQRRADLVSVTPAQQSRDLRDRDRRRKERGTSEDVPYRHHGWMRDDVASEALNRDLEPLLGPPRYDPIRLPEYEPKPSPVRQVSIEEYEASKQRPKKGGVNLSFLPKVNSGSADKINEGFDDHDYTERPDYRHDIAGYDDPRHEDGPHNPRYSPE